MFIEMKDNMYKGKPCRNCGNAIRYKSDKRCVCCRIETNQKFYQNHRAAAE